jgi:hypothetical protein
MGKTESDVQAENGVLLVLSLSLPLPQEWSEEIG